MPRRGRRIGDAAVAGIIDRLRPGMKEQISSTSSTTCFSKEGGENPCMVLAASENMFEPTSAFQRPRGRRHRIKQWRHPLLELGARDATATRRRTGKPIIYGPPPPDYRTCSTSASRLPGIVMR